MGSLLVVTGPPGAGKSTVAQVIIDALGVSEGPTALVAGDVFFAFLAGGAIAPWLPESQVQNTVVTEAMAMASGRFVAGDLVTVFDGVLGPWFIDTFLQAAGLDSIDYALLLPDVEVCLDRIRGRVGHGFSDLSAAQKMHDEFAKASIAGSHVITDSSFPAVEIADEILVRRAEGGLTYRFDPR